MNTDIDVAMHALFDGNRSHVVEVLKPRIVSRQATIQEQWLYACALEDHQQQLELFKQIQHSGNHPYSQMAADILKREAAFEADLQKAPPLQAWFIRRRQLLIYLFVTIAVLSGFSLVVLLLFTPPPESSEVIAQRTAVAQVQAAFDATQTVIALTPTVTPAATQVRGNSVSYLPIGTLQIMSQGFPTSLAVGQSNQMIPPPAGSAYAAIQYEFRCGPGLKNAAFCNAPGTEKIQLKLSDGTLVDWQGLTVVGSTAMGMVGTNQTYQGWLAFPVPAGRTPVALVLYVVNQVDQRDPVLFEVQLH